MNTAYKQTLNGQTRMRKRKIRIRLEFWWKFTSEKVHIGKMCQSVQPYDLGYIPTKQTHRKGDSCWESDCVCECVCVCVFVGMCVLCVCVCVFVCMYICACAVLIPVQTYVISRIISICCLDDACLISKCVCVRVGIRVCMCVCLCMLKKEDIVYDFSIYFVENSLNVH